MARMKRYFDTKAEAKKYLKELIENRGYKYESWEIHKQPKGTRHHGMFYIGSYIEWLNFAN